MSYITNVTHFLDEDGYPVHSGPAGRIGEFFGKIVAAASLHPQGIAVPSALRCRRRPGRKPCRGNLLIARRDDGVIEWQCPLCGDDGFIHSWEGTYWDRGKYAIPDLVSEDIIEFTVTEDEFKELMKPMILSPESEAILYSAILIEEVELCAPFDAFEEFMGEVAFEANHTDNRRREVILTQICERIETLLSFHDIVRDF
ncbi:MAG: hypothetical protein IBX64_12925 [Actinobacteria bacterium]|nr:hypothetical protein [Actinomycetota bacterium]